MTGHELNTLSAIIATGIIAFVFKALYDYFKPKKLDCPCQYIKDLNRKVIGEELREEIKDHNDSAIKNTVNYIEAGKGVRRVENALAIATTTQNLLLSNILDVLRQNGNILVKIRQNGHGE